MAVQKNQYADYLSYDPLPVLQIVNLVIRPESSTQSCGDTFREGKV